MIVRGECTCGRDVCYWPMCEPKRSLMPPRSTSQVDTQFVNQKPAKVSVTDRTGVEPIAHDDGGADRQG